MFLGGIAPDPPDPLGSLRSGLQSRSKGPVRKSSYFLGDPPPDPRSSRFARRAVVVELYHCFVFGLFLFGARFFGCGQPHQRGEYSLRIRINAKTRQGIPGDDLLAGHSNQSKRLIKVIHGAVITLYQ